MDLCICLGISILHIIPLTLGTLFGSYTFWQLTATPLFPSRTLEIRGVRVRLATLLFILVYHTKPYSNIFPKQNTEVGIQDRAGPRTTGEPQGVQDWAIPGTAKSKKFHE